MNAAPGRRCGFGPRTPGCSLRDVFCVFSRVDEATLTSNQPHHRIQSTHNKRRKNVTCREKHDFLKTEFETKTKRDFDAAAGGAVSVPDLREVLFAALSSPSVRFRGCDTRNSKPGTRNREPETQNPEPETRKREPESRNQKPEARILNP